MTHFTQTPAQFNIAGIIGDSFQLILDFDVNFTGWTWNSYIIDEDGTELTNFTISTIGAGSLGKLKLVLTGTQTTLLLPKRYSWYLKQTNNGSERIWVAGTYTLYSKHDAIPGIFRENYYLYTGSTIKISNTSSGVTAVVL
jgi:hypothetical protein